MATVLEEENAKGKEVIATSMEARRLRQPNRRKHEEEVEALLVTIREKENKFKPLASRNESSASLKDIKAERDATIERRKKIDADLKLVNQEITKKMGCLTKLQSSLHYKSEEKINEAIRRLDWQLNHQNFKLSEEKKIVAEVDSLKRSKKILGQYLAQKKEIEEMRDRARRMREERDLYFRTVTNLRNKEDELRKFNSESKAKFTALKQEIDELYEKKRQLIADFRSQEKEYQEKRDELRRRQRLETIRRKEEERRAKNEAIQKEYEEYRMQKKPYEDELILCATLMAYLHRCHGNLEPDTPASGEPTVSSKENKVVSELDGGMYILHRKQDEDYSAPRRLRRSRKSKKQFVAKLLTHTPQIFAQFDSLNLNAPSNMTEVPVSIEQLIARKKYYEEMATEFVCNEMLSTNSAVVQPSEHTGHGAWPFFVNEDQSQSENGLSVTESGGGELSRQPSKTESSGSIQDDQINDEFIEELVRLSAEDNLQKKENQEQENFQFDCFVGDTIEITAGSANQNECKNEVDTCICKFMDSNCVCTRTVCDNESNDDNSTVTDSESDCTRSRQNSNTTDATDCAENESHEIDNEFRSCDHSKNTMINIEDHEEYSSVCHDDKSHIANLTGSGITCFEENENVRNSGIIENLVRLSDVGGDLHDILASVPHTNMCKLDRKGCVVADIGENVI